MTGKGGCQKTAATVLGCKLSRTNTLRRRSRNWNTFCDLGLMPYTAKLLDFRPEIRGPIRSLFPLRLVTFQPPARGIPLLREDRMAARLLNGARHVVLRLVTLQRCRQKLMDVDATVRRPMGDADPECPPVPEIEEFHEDRRDDYDLEHAHGRNLHLARLLFRSSSIRRASPSGRIIVFIRRPLAKSFSAPARCAHLLYLRGDLAPPFRVVWDRRREYTALQSKRAEVEVISTRSILPCSRKNSTNEIKNSESRAMRFNFHSIDHANGCSSARNQTLCCVKIGKNSSTPRFASSTERRYCSIVVSLLAGLCVTCVGVGSCELSQPPPRA